MPKYYVAGIPFDSENALMHYGVKGMKWDKHIFGPDANTKYINWMDVGKMASSKRPSQFTDTGSDRSASQGGALRNSSQQKGPGLVRSALDKGAQLRYQANQAANQAGKAIGSAATSAARAAGGALNTASNFITGNQASKDQLDAGYEYLKKRIAATNPNAATNERDRMRAAASLDRAVAKEANESLKNRSLLDFAGKRSDRKIAEESARNAVVDQKRADDAARLSNQVRREQRQEEHDAYNKGLSADRAYNNTLPGMIGNGMNAVGNAADKGVGAAKGFINSAGKWVSNAAGDVGRSAATAWNGVRGAADSVGDWLGDRAGDVGRFLGTGERVTYDAGGPNERTVREPGFFDRAGQWIGDRANDVAGAATNAWNGVTGAVNDAGKWIGGAASDVGKAATNAWNGVTGAAGDAGKWISGAANDVGKAASNAGSWAGQAANDAGKWLGGAANDVGNAARNAWNGATGWIGGAANDVGKAASDAAGWIGDRAGDVGRTAASAWNGVTGASNDVGNFVTGNQARQNLEREQNAFNPFGLNNKNIANAQAEYNRTLPGMVDQAGNWISGAANDVGRFVSNAAGDVGKAATNAWNGVTGAANSVGDWAGNAARDVGSAAGSTMKALENAYGDASKWVVDNAGTVRDAVTGAALGTADWAVQQYKNLFHSAIDDKPDGVTDTFWKNYVASGGTREQYERDWR